MREEGGRLLEGLRGQQGSVWGCPKGGGSPGLRGRSRRLPGPQFCQGGAEGREATPGALRGGLGSCLRRGSVWDRGVLGEEMCGIEAFWGKKCGVSSRNRADVCLWVTVTGSWLLQITFQKDVNGVKFGEGLVAFPPTCRQVTSSIL